MCVCECPSPKHTHARLIGSKSLLNLSVTSAGLIKDIGLCACCCSISHNSRGFLIK